MVPAVSHKASPTSRYSGFHYLNSTYSYAALMLYGRLSHTVQIHFVSHVMVLQPRLCRNITGLGFFPFARHYSGNHYCFLFLCLLRCFSSAGLRYMQPFFKWLGFPIRKSTDQFIFADPRGLSQLITSFIASESQVIPRVPFLTFFYYTAFCSVCMLFDCCSVLVFSS